MRVVFFTEGGSGIGFGHVSRCRALADAFCENGANAVFCLDGDESVCALLEGCNYQFCEWRSRAGVETVALSRNDVAIIDSYRADRDIYHAIAERVSCAVYFDDYNRLSYPPGIIINGATGAENGLYVEDSLHTYLLGSYYLAQRSVFGKQTPKIINDSVSRVLLSVGGDDTHCFLPRLMRFLKETFPALCGNVVVTPAFQNMQEIVCESNEQWHCIESPSASNVRALMEESDIAIMAGGQMLYECAQVGLPVVAFCSADNQRNNLEHLHAYGFLEHVGTYENKDLFHKIQQAITRLLPYEERVRRSRLGQKLIDGCGAQRIVDAITHKIRAEHNV